MPRLRLVLSLTLCSFCWAAAALAAPARSARPAAVARPAATPNRATHRRPVSSASRATPRRATRKPAATTAAKAADGGAPPEPAPEAPPPDVADGHGPPIGAHEAQVAPTTTPAATGVVKTEEAEKGVKTYTFGAEEVEGRLRSPQILYFLRRVRAEFDAEPLGHRSFLLELSDTRRSPALE
jgi:hypothetical protein